MQTQISQLQELSSCSINEIEALPLDLGFIETFENNVNETINAFKLFDKSDKILVAVSGGKDSTVLVYLLKKFGYKFEAVTVDAHIGCYTEENLKNIRNHCQKLNVTLHEIPFREVFGASLCFIRDTLKEKGSNLKSCTICGVLRRYLLNKKAHEINATKLATGHNLDDEAQAIFMNLLKNRLELCARSGPINGISKSEKLVQRVKPFYLTSEEDIIKYSKMMQFPVHYGKCPCSVEGFRNSIKDGLNSLEKQYPSAKKNMVRYILKTKEKLIEKYSNSELINRCTSCGEACSDAICRACKLIINFKTSAVN